MDSQEIRAYCVLNRTIGFKNRLFLDILATFESPVSFLESSYSEIQDNFKNFPLEEFLKIQKLYKSKDKEVEREIDWLKEDKHHLLTINDELYPYLLKEISDPPPVLFVNGEVELLGMLQLAVVGSRKSSPIGEEMCYQISQEVAQTGIIITSGMALGIDGCSHRAALDVGGKTIAVWGTGLDIVYPSAHHQLAHQIAKNGALVSEFPLGVGAKSFHFPRRNRIISGLCAGILVVEASIKSGSLITARLASEQGREVFALPHSLRNPNGEGCHKLIKNGAKLTENANDILEEFRLLAQRMTLNYAQTEKKEQIVLENRELELFQKLSEKQKIVLEAMGFDAIRADDLVEITKIPIFEISAILSELELEGLIDAISGGRYLRN